MLLLKESVNLPSVDKSTARGPVKLELTRAVGHRGSIKTQCLGRSIGGGELDKTVTGITSMDRSRLAESPQVHVPRDLSFQDIPRVLVTDHLDIDSLASSRKEDTLDEVFVHPRLELAHPSSCVSVRLKSRVFRYSLPEGRLWLVDATARRGRNSSHVRGRGGSVGKRHFYNL